MPRVENGPIGASSGGLAAVLEAPRARVAVVPDRTPVPVTEIYRFVTNHGSEHQYTITKRADADDQAMTDAVLSYPEHNRGVIAFSEWAFGTPHRTVAEWLDKRIREGERNNRPIGIWRDAAQLRLRCTECDDFIVFNTPQGLADLNVHMTDTHTATLAPVSLEEGRMATKTPVSSSNAATNLTPGNVAIPTLANRAEIYATTVDCYVGVHTANTGFTPGATNSIRVKAGNTVPVSLDLDPETHAPRNAAGQTGAAAVRDFTYIHFVGVAAGPGTIDINFFR